MAEQTKAKLIQDRQEEEARIALLCGEEGLAPSEDNVAQCSMKCFAKLLAPQARKFIKYRSNMTANQLNALKKPSTALQDALAGVKNVVSEAYALRAVKSRLLAAVVNPTQNETTAVQVGTNYNSPLAVHVPLADPTASIIMPSTILQDAAKVKLIIDTFDPQGKLKHIDVVRPLEKTLVDRVDMLFEKLQVRLNGHVSRKVRLNQQSHYVWKWARKNLAIVTVWMVVVSQVKDNIAPLDEYKCLLSPKKDRFFLCTNVESVLFGCYLFFDTNDNIWIRSGKATGADGIGGRLGEHTSRASSNLNNDGSLFYHLYPSRSSCLAHVVSTEVRASMDTTRIWLLQLQLHSMVEVRSWPIDLQKTTTTRVESSSTPPTKRNPCSVPNSPVRMATGSSWTWLRIYLSLAMI